MKIKFPCIILTFGLLLFSCGNHTTSGNNTYIAITGGTIIDGTGNVPIENGVMLIKNGYIDKIGKVNEIQLPASGQKIDVTGQYIIPGLINSHGHVGDVKGIDPGHYSAENIKDVLCTYAWYGITSVMSLGGDGPEAEAFREVNDTTIAPGRARLYIAGTIVTGNTPAEADRVVDRDVKMGVDIIKIRVDDYLGTAPKMPEEIYRAVIKRAHEHDLQLAVHLFYLGDAKKLLNDGADFIAHSVRDTLVDPELTELIRQRNVCYCPTLTRELSTFVYGETPDFFSDPFFLARVDSSVIRKLEDPKRQRKIRESRSAAVYQKALVTAEKNLKLLSDQGVKISMGTDTGMPARFPGFFEHLEMEMMEESGLTPMQVIVASTRNPAECLGMKNIGILTPGKLADFVTLDKDPLKEIKNLRSISSVWIGGKRFR